MKFSCLQWKKNSAYYFEVLRQVPCVYHFCFLLLLFFYSNSAFYHMSLIQFSKSAEHFAVLIFNMLPKSKGFVTKITYWIHSYSIHIFLALVGLCIKEILWIHKLRLSLILLSKAIIKRNLSLKFILRKTERKRKRERDWELVWCFTCASPVPYSCL